MKLLRYGAEGFEKPGILDADGKIRDLSGIVGDIDGAALAPEASQKLKRPTLPRCPLLTATRGWALALARLARWFASV